MKPQHSCLKISVRPTDYVFGSQLPFKSLYGGDWTPYLKFFEDQRVADGDTDDCVIFTAQESFDAQIEAMMPNLDPGMIELMNQLGFMDTNSLDGKAHFHSSPRFWGVLTGNGANGNNLPDPWDAARKYGVLPYEDLPVSSSMTVAEYYASIPQNMMSKAAQFLASIGGKNAIQYHWVCNGKENLAAMALALQQAPVCLGTPVCEPWDQIEPPVCQGSPAHSTLGYKIEGQDVSIYDHYEPAGKTLQSGYPIPYALQGIVTITPPVAPTPPATTYPPNPTPQQAQAWYDWLVKVAQWLGLLEE